jgi:hypothetical protein
VVRVFLDGVLCFEMGVRVFLDGVLCFEMGVGVVRVFFNGDRASPSSIYFSLLKTLSEDIFCT